MTVKRWQEMHEIRGPQEAARQLRAAGYLRKVHKGLAVWYPNGSYANRAWNRLSDAELEHRVKVVLLAHEGIVTVPKVVKAIGRVWNASIQRRVTDALKALGCLRCDVGGVWSAPWLRKP